MCKYIVSGGNKIEGKLNIRGAKNSILPIMAATILNENKSIIHNVPNISDVYIMIKILESIGCKVDYEPDTLIIDSSNINSGEIDEEYVRQMRSSIIIMGAMIGRLNYTKINYPKIYNPSDTQRDIVWVNDYNELAVMKDGDNYSATSARIAGLQVKASKDGINMSCQLYLRIDMMFQLYILISKMIIIKF